MPNLGKEDKAAKRRERRRLRREKKKGTVIIPETAKDNPNTFPMIYDWKDPVSYDEGFKSTATLVRKVTTLAPSKVDEEFLNLTCYGKFIFKPNNPDSFREFVLEYYIPMTDVSSLAKKKHKEGATINILNRSREKIGTMYDHEGRLCFIIRRDDLLISGDIDKKRLAEALHEHLSAGADILIKTVPKPHTGEHQHKWEKRVGILKPNQIQETTIYTCTECGVKFKCNHPKGVPPTFGCRPKSEGNVVS